ncbi:MAG: adenine deaminase [Planctomycetes bacterium]|nr:adenine deaminase [Planctomycetota bacterium]
MELKRLIDIAAGRQPADLVLKNGRVVNVFTEEILEADVAIAGDRIAGVGSYEGAETVDLSGQFVCPGFIDAHVHIESSMLSVPEFAKLAAAHGTAAVITDPHEIANVMGIEGIRYMLDSAKGCPLRIYVMLSSCVPASHLESAGANLSADDLRPLLDDPCVLGLAEMMNFPGVVNGDEQVLNKLQMCSGRVIDGHSPGLAGRDLQAYIASGIGSDHECTTLEEAREKLRAGQCIMIREGSQARNLETLLPLVTPETAHRFMFVTDDKDVEDLLTEGHVDHIIRKAISCGLKPATAIRLASINAARYFGLEWFGAVAPGYAASLAILDNLEDCRVQRVYHEGQLIAEKGRCVAGESAGPVPVPARTMNVHQLQPEQFGIKASGGETQKVHVIEMIEDQLVTHRCVEALPVVEGLVMPDPSCDIAQLVVIERHGATGRMGFGFIRGFGLRAGAIASTVAHDAHNIVVVGTNVSDIYEAAVHAVKLRGGLCAVKDGKVLADMPLPIAGLMSDAPAAEAGQQLSALQRATTQELGSTLRKPFMALSFMSLSVIGSLKVTDLGLIDVDQFKPIELFL